MNDTAVRAALALGNDEPMARKTRWVRDREIVDICFSEIDGTIDRWKDLEGYVLDLGSVSGWYILKLDKAKRVVLDIAPPRVKDDVLMPVQGNMLALPFPDDTFELVVARGVLHHVPELLPEALDEIKRVLRPGGHLLIQDPGGLNPPAVIMRAVAPTEAHDPDERPFDPKLLEREVGGRFERLEVGHYLTFGYLLPHIVPRLPTRFREAAHRLSRMIVGLDRWSARLGPARRMCGYIQIVATKGADADEA